MTNVILSEGMVHSSVDKNKFIPQSYRIKQP
jgi:hypothetical protein